MWPFPKAASARRPYALPLFPLKTVLFPGGLLPLKIFEQRYIEMAKACMKDDATLRRLPHHAGRGSGGDAGDGA